VAVYGEWPGQPAHIVPTFSPSYSDADWEMESDGVMAKIQKLQQSDNVQQPVKLISVGALNKNKNHQLIVHAVKQLADRNIDAHLTLLGEGPERNALTHLIESLGLGQQVHLNGNTSQADVRGFYRDADFVVQPSLTEGFSKVPLEACFHGAIPLLSDINLNPQVVGGTDRGRCYPVDDASLLARHIAELSHDSAEMVRLIKNCRDYAHDHTLESWRQHIKQMLERHWQIRL
jgi:glycosyltransferase involved in cell wall biosynthesis